MPLRDQFGRRLRVRVHGKIVCDWQPFGDEDANEQLISLDTEFTVLQHAKPEPLTCELIIYNLAEESREQLTADATRAREIGWKQYQKVQTGAILVEPGGEAAAAQALVASFGLVEIEAGYQDDFGLLSRTQILADGVTHKYVGTEWVTTIRSQDSRLPWQNAFVTQSIAPGVNLRDVNAVMIASQQFLEGTLAEEAFQKQFPELLLKRPSAGYKNGFVLHGEAQRESASIADTLGIEYYYLNGDLVYVPKGSASLPDAVRLSRANNLLSTVPMARNFRQATTLVDYRIQPGRQVQLFKKDDVTPIGGGIFRVDSVVHAGANFGNRFQSVAALRPSALDAKTNL